MTFWRYYVYIHRRADTGEPFYVGKGSTKVPGMYGRAYDCERTSRWTRIATDAGGVVVEIFAHCNSDDAALALEYCIMQEFSKLHPLENVLGLQADRRRHARFLGQVRLLKLQRERPELFAPTFLPSGEYRAQSRPLGLVPLGRPRNRQTFEEAVAQK